MSRSADAIVNPELLVWGRETIGYDLESAAKKIGVKPERLADWENGHKQPTIKKLFTIANVYKRPFAAFYFSHPPTHWDEPYDKLEDWRSLPETDRKKKPPGLVLELREAARRREILLDLAEEMDEAIPEFDLICQMDESPSSLANRARILLGISVADQKSCKTSGMALRKWRLAVESLGVLVFQSGFFGGHFPVTVGDMRGAALYFDLFPIIVLNSKDSENGRVFTIMHELGHLILRQSGLSNFDDYERPVTDEVFCNKFAGELLVPTSNLLRDTIVISHTGMHWSDSDLTSLSDIYKVSREVILRRLQDLNLTSSSHYAAKVAKWKKEYTELQETETKSRGWARHYKKFVKCHGARFVSTVLDAYDQEIIHAGLLSEYLGSKLQHIEDIRNDLVKELG